jgi:hypothetical protein
MLLASSANFLNWGTVGQVDMSGLCFSLAAFLQFSRSRARGKPNELFLGGAWIILAVFTKQTFVAAGAAIALLVCLDNRRRGLMFAACLGSAGLLLALLLNGITADRFFDNAVLANLNPFSAQKAWRHLQYFAPVSGGLVILTTAGWIRRSGGRFHPFHVYLAAAAACWRSPRRRWVRISTISSKQWWRFVCALAGASIDSIFFDCGCGGTQAG